MKKLVLLTIISSMLSLSAYSELTVEDYEKIQQLLKEQTKELKEQIKELKDEIQAAETRTKTYIDLKVDKTNTVLAEKIETNYVRIQGAERTLTIAITLMGILLAGVAIPLSVIAIQYIRNNRINRAATPPIEEATPTKP